MKASSGADRSYGLRMPEGWEPPYPSFSSEFDGSAKDVGMVVAGVQFKSDDKASALTFIQGLAYLMRKEGVSDHVDLSYCEKDSTGSSQMVATGYWLDSKGMADFFEDIAFKSYWVKHSGEGSSFGIFREVYNFPHSRFETLHSGPEHVVGIANVREQVSEPLERHAYWGGMRDRIPDSAENLFKAEGAPSVVENDSDRIVVKPNINMAIIRSGQDLGKAVGIERDEYFNDIEPVLKAGLNFLRDDGGEVNCFDCRYMSLMTEEGEITDHTYGLAYFYSLEDLEKWSEHHPTHLAIFNAFLEFAPRYGPEMRSRYWHEVSVIPDNHQFAEYINCLPGTGFLSEKNDV